MNVCKYVYLYKYKYSKNKYIHIYVNKTVHINVCILNIIVYHSKFHISSRSYYVNSRSLYVCNQPYIFQNHSSENMLCALTKRF